MKYLGIIFLALLFNNLAFADKICVRKKAPVTAAGRVNMVKAIQYTTGDCTGRQFELAIPEQPVKTTLPSGETITGFYALGGTADAANEFFRTEISFSIPLSEEPTVEIVELGDPATTNCPGSALEPSAAPGFLCIYEGKDGSSNFGFPPPATNRKELNTRNFATIFVVDSNQTTVHGAEINARSVTDGSVVSSGTWAVTAPN